MDLTRRSFIASLTASAGAAMATGAYAQAPLKIVATTGMIADLVRQIGGNHVQVHALMGPGVDPHAYRQTRSDIVAMTRADIVFRHGLYLEAQMEDFFHKLEKRGTLVSVADSIPQKHLISHPDYADKFDPHIWMTPDLWRQIVPVVQQVLSNRRPSAANAFAANSAAYLDQIQQLADYTKQTMASVPDTRRVLLTAHDAFGYFGRTYGLEVIGIQGISTESEAGLNRITQLVDMLVSREIGAVFVESSVSDRNIRALIEGAVAQGHKVTIGGELFSDAMGQNGTYEGTYLGMIDHNTTTIARALGGTAPARGMTGQLSAGL